MLLRMALMRMKTMWHQWEAGMMSIRVPEEKVNSTYRGAISAVLSSRSRTAAEWVRTPTVCGT